MKLYESVLTNLSEADSMSVEDELDYLKELAGNTSLCLDKDMKYENGKLNWRSKTGWHEEKDRPVRNTGDYKVYARHFNCALPYTNYYIVNVNNGRVFRFSEHTTWTPNVLKELTENLKAGYNVEKKMWEDKYKNEDFDPIAWMKDL